MSMVAAEGFRLAKYMGIVTVVVGPYLSRYLLVSFRQLLSLWTDHETELKRTLPSLPKLLRICSVAAAWPADRPDNRKRLARGRPSLLVHRGPLRRARTSALAPASATSHIGEASGSNLREMEPMPARSSTQHPPPLNPVDHRA